MNSTEKTVRSDNLKVNSVSCLQHIIKIMEKSLQTLIFIG